MLTLHVTQPWRSCCPRRRKISHFWEYDRTYMVKAGTPSQACFAPCQHQVLLAHFKAFCRQRPLTITLDTGAETSMIKATVARALNITIDKTSLTSWWTNLIRPYDSTCTEPIWLQDNYDQTLLLKDNQAVTTANKHLQSSTKLLGTTDLKLHRKSNYLLNNQNPPPPSTQRVVFSQHWTGGVEGDV